MSFISFGNQTPFTTTGITLNLEETASLKNSLCVKKSEEKIENLHFWGKILGIQKDYYISIGWHEGEWFTRKLDLINWLQLPQITVEDMQACDSLNGRFMGDPAYDHSNSINHLIITAIENKNEEETKQKILVKEEIRLASVITKINHDSEIVPRGVYHFDQLHKLQVNSLYPGLLNEELDQLSSYLHFRSDYKITSQILLEKGELFNPTIDIFEPISCDKPKGVL